MHSSLAHHSRVILSLVISLAFLSCGGNSPGTAGTSTGVPDTTPPSVSSTNPAPNANGVPLNLALSAIFSEPISPATVTSSTFSLTDQANTVVTGTVTSNGTTAMFTPSTSLDGSTAYTATLTTGIKDLAGNMLAAPYTWTFTTGTASSPPSFTKVIVTPNSPNNPWGKELGDINGDGKPDIIVAGSNGPLLWYAAPAWTVGTIAANGDYQTESGLALGDIDADGDLDVIVGYVWYENPRPGNPVTGPWSRHIIDLGLNDLNHDILAVDLDNDGKLDVAMRGEGRPEVIIYKQVTPTSWTKKTLDPGFGSNGLAAADLDGDGFRDLIVGGRWLKNPGGDIIGGAWSTFIFEPSNTWDWAGVAAVDFNSDGLIDIVLSVSEIQPGPVTWFQNPGNPTTSNAWIQHPIAPSLQNVHRVAIADMNNDGKQDVVASEYAGQGRLIIYTNGGGGLSWTANTIGNTGLHNIKAADIGNDGDMDIVGSIAFGVGNVELWENGLTGGGPAQNKVLIFTKVAPGRSVHAGTPSGVAAIQTIGAQNNFSAVETQDATLFTSSNLAQYKAVVFLNTNGDVLDTAQENAFKSYINAGGGFVGIHSAADTENGWDWYAGLVGALYGGSHTSDTTQATNRIEIASHPSTQGLPDPWVRTDEWYNYDRNPRTASGVTVLVRLDELTYSGGTMGSDHPIAWYHAYDGGRAWYTGGGSNVTPYSEPLFLSHLKGGILYAMGILPP